ncbi:SIMPL domain-containing protein [Pseudalkalibacillus hwajinpoensis]|uniref:SIMPL domain-containing protein n=1 Tax=Guptibacillus hwajinpoensis TaxID=208199 RepID=UPI001CD45567|nr:SIMPL domain-containing protein [Pseudalkalibacillus hwajinpoensis]MCA0990617.1 SIMPL domain-containing protein [Pseudalkalibacillus hwajinpoensis]
MTNMTFNDQCVCDHTITVFGAGEVSAAPDRAVVVTGVTTTSEQVAEAQEENAALISSIVSSLHSLGIPSENIQTTDYRIEENIRYENNVKIFLGYKVTHLLKVYVEPVSRTGAAIDAAVASGANVVSDIRFELKDPTIAYQKALAIAIKDAKEKAKTIAQAIDIGLPHSPHQIIELSSSSPSPRMFSDVQATQIQTGQLVITAQLKMSYLLK